MTCLPLSCLAAALAALQKDVVVEGRSLLVLYMLLGLYGLVLIAMTYHAARVRRGPKHTHFDSVVACKCRRFSLYGHYSISHPRPTHL